MIKQQAQAVWRGGLKDGNGSFRSGTIDGNYSFASRFEGGEGSTPEVLARPGIELQDLVLVTALPA